MTRDEIYDHLAKVYLDKKEIAEKSFKTKPKLNAWVFLNLGITAVILVSVFYGFSAFLANRGQELKTRVVYSLTNSPLRINYNVEDPFPQVKTFSLDVPQMDLSRFSYINLSLRGKNHNNPGVLKLIVRNKRNEVASHYIQGIASQWKKHRISFNDLDLTDWTTIEEMSFVIEAWNAQDKQGTVLVDDISFSN